MTAAYLAYCAATGALLGMALGTWRQWRRRLGVLLMLSGGAFMFPAVHPVTGIIAFLLVIVTGMGGVELGRARLRRIEAR